MASRLGDQHDKLKKEFAEKLVAIETKYADILAAKINRYTGKPPDELIEHFYEEHDYKNHKICFRKDSYLPKHIQDEIMVAFVSIFSAL